MNRNEQIAAWEHELDDLVDGRVSCTNMGHGEGATLTEILNCDNLRVIALAQAIQAKQGLKKEHGQVYTYA